MREIIIPDAVADPADSTESGLELSAPNEETRLTSHSNLSAVYNNVEGDGEGRHGKDSAEVHHDHVTVHFLNEPALDAIDDTSPIRSQLHEIWQTVQLKSVWQPMTFVFLFNLFQVPNVAWQSYLQLSLVILLVVDITEICKNVIHYLLCRGSSPGCWA